VSVSLLDRVFVNCLVHTHAFFTSIDGRCRVQEEICVKGREAETAREEGEAGGVEGSGREESQSQVSHCLYDSDESECCDNADEITVVDVQIGQRNGLRASSSGVFGVSRDGYHDQLAIKRSFNWAFHHGALNTRTGTVDHRQQSLIFSFRMRFPDLSEYFNSSLPSSGYFSPVRRMESRITIHDVGSQFVFVETEEHCRTFLEFCQASPAVAIDTEGAPYNTNIDLVQIGNGKIVFLCPVRSEYFEILIAVAKSIFLDGSKRVMQFGSDDVTKFLHGIGLRIDTRCTLINVQDRLREEAGLPTGKSPGLPSSVAKLIGDGRVLCKAWTNSGWDVIPLHPEQAEYAALDVIFAFRLGCEMR